ncbi:MAG TPA: SET domain-containing protein [Gemmatimonadaceae bacterium]|nr:SET domain-containing protein [Gemmatimonadaceae bacterium]
MNPPVEARRSRIGMGLFATRDIAPADTILRLEGQVLHWRAVLRRRGPSKDNCYRFGPETYLDPGDHVGRYANHSCVPNAGVRKKRGTLYLFADRAIRAGAEICFDYSTLTGDDDVWTLRCRCDRRRCRGVIGNFGALPSSLRRRYLRRGLVPDYIVATLDPPVNAR